jgi:hypothetical protein
MKSILAFAAAVLGAIVAEKAHAEPAKPLLVATYYVWYRSGDDPKEPHAGWIRPGKQRPLPPGTPKHGKAGEPPIASTAYPLAGLYDSGDPAVAAWHVRLARAAGIDAFLCSWWGPHKGRDRAFEKGILAAAEKHRFKIALLDERAQFHNDFAWYKDHVVGYLTKYKDSPAWWRIDGRPVLYLYQVATQATLTPAKFAELRRHVESKTGPVFWIVDKIAHDAGAARRGKPDEIKRIPGDWLKTPGIDAFAFYSTFSNFRAHRYEELAGKYRYITGLAHAAKRKMVLPVHPGHDNSRFGENVYVMPHRGGRTLKDHLRAADEARADIVMVTSWNEWPETTVVEPSATWNDPYRYLKILADWKGVRFKAPQPPKR